MMAHYTGAALNLKQTLMQGRGYNAPMSNFDIDRIGEQHVEEAEILGYRAKNNDENIKKEKNKNSAPADPKIGERQVE